MVTKRRLATLPDVESFRRLSQSLAVLDAILSPEWEYRYYSFNSKWAANEMMASMRNGTGDDYFVLFNPAGAIIKGFAHESPMSPYANESLKVWPGVLDEVPGEFTSFLSEPAFSIESITFCLWRKYEQSTWQVGTINYPEANDPDGSEELLWMLDGNPSSYQEFIESYYEVEIELSAIEHIYQHKALTDAVIQALNADASLADLQADIEEIGYPGT